MFQLLWLVVAIPFVSAVLLALFGSRLPRRMVAISGAGSIGFTAALTLLIGAEFITSPPAGNAYVQHLWIWMNSGGLQPEIALYLDSVALLMLLVVTFVGFLIHLYSVEYMLGDEGYARFFAYMNLFVASMITLVLANNLLLLYLGWEGVGLCSFLLIGFWYPDPVNVRAASKAFIVTRVGDTAFAVGLFLLSTRLGTLDIQELMHRAPVQWNSGSGIAVAAAGAVVGRSSWQICANAASNLVAGRDGRPHAHERTHSRRDHGDRGSLPDCTHARALYAGSSRSVCGGQSLELPRCYWRPSVRLPSVI